MKINSFLFILCLLAFISSGCSEKTIEEEKFIKIYTDLIIAIDTTENAAAADTLPFKKIIFKRYGITADEYEQTIKYYNEEPERWENFFNKTISYLEQEKKKITDKNKPRSKPNRQQDSIK